MTILFAIFVYVIIDAVYNYGVIKWGEAWAKLRTNQEEIQRYSFIWHFVGALKFIWVIISIYHFKTNMPFLWIVVWSFWIRWFFFDLILNILRDRPPFYVGYSSTIDKFYRKTSRPELYMVLTKVLIFVLLVVLWTL